MDITDHVDHFNKFKTENSNRKNKKTEEGLISSRKMSRQDPKE